MRQPSRGTLRLLILAAAQRACGAGWEAIGQLVGRRPETCRRWPRQYPDLWMRLLREADAHATREAAAEAVVVLRQLERFGSTEKVRRQAAGILARAEREGLVEPPPAPD
jgi:hypothetical protein